MFNILVVEDNDNLRYLIAKNLSNEKFNVTESNNGQDALEKFFSSHFDLIVTDIMMPQLNGNEFVKRVRQENFEIPIIMLTALETIEDKEVGFNNGTDDYMVKPVNYKELVLRINALLRRSCAEVKRQVNFTNCTVDYNSNVAIVNGKEVELTKKQLQLLFKLLSNPNKIFTRERLMDEIWGMDSNAMDRTVDTHISWLRDKVKCNDFEIVTVRGVGYKVVVK